MIRELRLLGDSSLGCLVDPLSDRVWEAADVLARCGRRMALFTALGVRSRDRVFLHYGNRPEFFADLLAIWFLGGCAVPVDGRLTASEVDNLARFAQPRISLWEQEPDAELARSLSGLGVGIALLGDGAGKAAGPCTASPGRFSLDDDALILFTSGTTGQPKGVVHTHRSLRARWMSLRQSLGVESFRRTLCLLPTHFGHGLICNSLFPWLFGQDLYILPPFRADLLVQLGPLLDRHEITFLSSVPSVWRLALKTARPPESRILERVFCGSAPLSASLWRSIQEWTGAREVFNAYGITETGSWLAGTTLAGFEPEDGLVGEAWGGVVRIFRSRETSNPSGLAEPCSPGEPGYVWVNTPALMRGYLDREDLTEQVVSRGWFMTGDIGLLDERGWLYLRGREREEINRGGMKIYPADIDSVAERFEGTRDVCSFAYPDALHGENVGIAVVLDSPGEAVLRRLQEWCATYLSRDQLPRRWYVLDEIPRTSRGKVNREAVARRCAELREAKLPQPRREGGGR
jgi:acyl-CoA synthetase (AMP-forming)/AMP-acid ligase II